MVQRGRCTSYSNLHLRTKLHSVGGTAPPPYHSGKPRLYKAQQKIYYTILSSGQYFPQTCHGYCYTLRLTLHSNHKREDYGRKENADKKTLTIQSDNVNADMVYDLKNEELQAITDKLGTFSKKLHRLYLSIRYYTMNDVWNNATAGMLDRSNGEVAQMALGRWKRAARVR